MRYLFFIILYACCCLQMLAAVKLNDVMIDSVAYDYELHESGSKLDCVGTLKIYVSASPDDAKYFLLGLNFKEPRPNFFKYKITYPTTETILKAPIELRWDGNFKLAIFLENDEYIVSDTYYVKDFMDPNDVALLLGSSEMDEINDSMSFDFGNHKFKIFTNEQTFIQIADVYGRVLFSGIVENEAEIPIAASVIIVNIRSKNHNLTKKLLMK